MTYKEKLRDPRWQRKRLGIFQRDDFRCRACQDTENTLHVHHRAYLQYAEPWDYPDDMLITLCEHCHELETIAVKDSVSQLVTACKIKLSSQQISDLAEGIESLNFEKGFFWGDVLKFWLCSPENRKTLVSKYLKSIPKNG